MVDGLSESFFGLEIVSRSFRRALSPQQAPSLDGKFKAVLDAGLFEYVHQVDFYRAGGDRQCLSDFLVFKASADVLDNVLLARG